MGKAVLFVYCNALQDRTARSGGERARDEETRRHHHLGPFFPLHLPIPYPDGVYASRQRRRARALTLTS
jgi:hypothetical protein